MGGWRLVLGSTLVLVACGTSDGTEPDAGPPPPPPPDASLDAVATADAAEPDAADATVGHDAGPPPPRAFITDELGRALILHGANDGTGKNDPLRSPALTADDVRRMARDWGFNLHRYLVFWDAAEPMPGFIDQAYLDRVEERLDWFAEHGIFVMIDMHQDVYAARFCCDGAPEWAIRDDGEPFTPQEIWSLNYLQPAVQRAFDNFWSYEEPHRDLQDHYAGVWAAIAMRFRDHPAVLGFDLMNEPSPGSLFDLRETLSGVGAGEGSRSERFDRTLLAPFYRRVIERIREVDPDHWIFVEPRFGGPGNGAVQYLPVIEDPRPGPSRIVFAPHLYSIRYEGRMEYDRAEDQVVDRWEAARIEETRLQNWPIVMGEFGMDRTFPGAAEYLDDVLQMADRMMISWAYWSFTPGTWGWWDPATMTEHPNADQLVRPYPQRVAGTPREWSWDRESRVFTLRFDDAPGVSGPTEIFLPVERFFADGYSVDSNDAPESWSQSWDADRQVLSLTTSASDETHVITIRPE